jgi:hypothetical protein
MGSRLRGNDKVCTVSSYKFSYFVIPAKAGTYPCTAPKCWLVFKGKREKYLNLLFFKYFLSNSRRPVSPVLARGSKKLFRTFLPINWMNRGNGVCQSGRDAVLPPDRLNSPGWDECEFISRDAFKQGSKARYVFQRELLAISKSQNSVKS